MIEHQVTIWRAKATINVSLLNCKGLRPAQRSVGLVGGKKSAAPEAQIRMKVHGCDILDAKKERKAKKEAGVPQDEIKAFMATAPTACKFLLTKVKDCEVFINEDFDDKGAICLREWAEQGNVYYYIEPGLERVRC